MPRALITGASGFVGPYLARHLTDLGYEVWGTTASGEETLSGRSARLDVRRADQVNELVKNIMPDEIYHLAAISRPSLPGFAEYYDVNLQGTLNVLEAAKAADAAVLVISSAYVYGAHDYKINETTELRPVNHYGASKAAADLASVGYALEGLRVVRARPFNHSGPGQSHDFLLPALVNQVVQVVSQKAAPVIEVGNLESVRDFSDVRDVVRAYHLLLANGVSGEVYNVASGSGISVSALAKRILRLAGVAAELKSVPTKQRSTDIPYLVGSAEKTTSSTGWSPIINLDETIRSMLAERIGGLNL